MTSEACWVVVSVGRHIISLMEESRLEGKRNFRLSVDQFHQVVLSFAPWCFPGISVSSEKIVVWGGVDLYLFDFRNDNLLSFELNDEIFTVYAVGRIWCLVCELSVVLFDLESGQELSRFEHDEVILKNWWSDNNLVLEDFEGKRFYLDIDLESLKLIAVQRHEGKSPRQE